MKTPIFLLLMSTAFILIVFSAQAQNSSESQVHPLVFLDDKIISSEEMKQINADNISAVEVIKDSALIIPYGSPGKNGVIRIYSIKYATLKYQQVLSQVSAVYQSRLAQAKSDTGFLYILREQPLLTNPSGSLIYLKPDSIQSVEFTGRQQCLKTYGETKSNGCFVIKMK
ncbi:MAG: hypothetical protein WCK09_09995 [Bacteroidota bacterium]